MGIQLFFLFMLPLHRKPCESFSTSSQMPIGIFWAAMEYNRIEVTTCFTWFFLPDWEGSFALHPSRQLIIFLLMNSKSFFLRVIGKGLLLPKYLVFQSNSFILRLLLIAALRLPWMLLEKKHPDFNRLKL